ncbi:hypothetical protein F5X68DRAFT_196766 [Plectosphaerella plurivora]|uniref:Uncharacterized protein n=1 Tax=Plectosphaerella plurivora TaxID=936078 RepID=A0A9P9AI81_9PEZI|nr:hypothetical protein F5X68DRAFT_196766 [Plectosphaerella plurivora]
MSRQSTEHIIASRDFLIAHMQTELVKLRKNANKIAMMGAPIKHRGNDWTMLIWKGMGVFAPVRVAYWMREFVVHAIVAEQEHAWNMCVVRDFFRLGQVLAVYNIPEACGASFIKAGQLDVVLARVDKLLLHGTNEAITVHDLLARVGSVLELIGKDKDMNWELVFTRRSRYFNKRRLELVEDDKALEAIIGPMSTWYIVRQSIILNTDVLNQINDDEMLEL